MKQELEGMWKDGVLVYLKVLSNNISAWTEDNNEYSLERRFPG
jgi:hypothetical protein